MYVLFGSLCLRKSTAIGRVSCFYREDIVSDLLIQVQSGGNNYLRLLQRKSESIPKEQCMLHKVTDFFLKIPIKPEDRFCVGLVGHWLLLFKYVQIQDPQTSLF